MTEEERRRLLEGILGFNRARRRMGPGLSQSFGRDIGALKRGISTYANNLPTIEITEGQPRFRPQPGKGGAPSGLYGVPKRVRG